VARDHRIVFYISGHGFGHASRDAVVINALARRLSPLQIVVRSTVPRWFLDSSLAAEVHIVDGPVDTGVVQPNSLAIDEEETARRAAAFLDAFDAHINREAALLRSAGASLIVGDIPPLAFAAAAQAGVPSIALANFTWDWIYDGFPRFRQTAPGVIEHIADAYAGTTLALRLPFSGGFASMPRVDDIPLVGRRATLTRGDVRQRLDLASTSPLVFASFGGHGRAIPLDRATSPDEFTIVATDYESPDGLSDEGLRILSAATMDAAGVSYTDLLAACDVVVTKIGYGIVADCIVNDVAMLYAERTHFVEQTIFARELPAVLRCRTISREDLVAGMWTDPLRALLAQPGPVEKMRTDGAEVAASRIADLAASP
jgi:hypothetical protein